MKGRCSKSNSIVHRLPVFAVGLLVGGLIGAAAMLLLAPRSGKKTRSQIQKQGTNIGQEAVENMEDVVTDAGGMAHDLADSVQNGIGELQHHAKDLLDAAKK